MAFSKILEAALSWVTVVAGNGYAAAMLTEFPNFVPLTFDYGPQDLLKSIFGGRSEIILP